jgi:hypothetical protein
MTEAKFEHSTKELSAEESRRHSVKDLVLKGLVAAGVLTVGAIAAGPLVSTAFPGIVTTLA